MRRKEYCSSVNDGQSLDSRRLAIICHLSFIVDLFVEFICPKYENDLFGNGIENFTIYILVILIEYSITIEWSKNCHEEIERIGKD